MLTKDGFVPRTPRLGYDQPERDPDAFAKLHTWLRERLSPDDFSTAEQMLRDALGLAADAPPPNPGSPRPGGSQWPRTAADHAVFRQKLAEGRRAMDKRFFEMFPEAKNARVIP
jgi:hypothetical protein